MANKKINELLSRTPSLSDLMLVGDPSSGYSYKCTVHDIANIIESDIGDAYVTLTTTQSISGAKTFSNVLTLTSVANSSVDTDKFLVLTGTNTVNYRTGAEVLSDIGAQAALTNPVTGTGTTDYLAKFTGTSTIGSSSIQDTGTLVTIYSSSKIRGTGIYLDLDTTFVSSVSYLNFRIDGTIANQIRSNSQALQFYSNGTSAGNLIATLNSSGLTLNTLSQATVDTDKFLVSDSGVIKYRTGAELLSDIGGASSTAISGTTNYIPKFTSSTAIGNSVIYESSSNIGIGITSPSARLHVNGTGRFEGGVYAAEVYLSSPNSIVEIIDSTNANGGYLQFSTSSTVIAEMGASQSVIGSGGNDLFVINGKGARDLILATNATERVRIASTGAVTLSTIANATTDTDKFLVSDSGVIKYRTGAELLSDIGGASSSSVSGTTNYIPKFTSSNAIGNSIIRESGSGIGINGTPTAFSTYSYLTVYGTATTTGGVFDSRTSNSSSHMQVYADATGANIFGGTNHPMIFYTNTSERMRLDASGNLGLGTSSPLAKFQVLASNGSQIAIDYGGSSINYYDANTQIFRNASYTERMRLDASGNLGLGVTPASWATVTPLQIKNAAFIGFGETAYMSGNAYFNAGWKYIASSGAGRYDIDGGSGGEHRWYSAGSGTAGAAISFTQSMTLNSSGNLGLGVTPSAWTLGKAFEVGNVGSSIWAYGVNSTVITSNAIWNAGWKYAANGTATHYGQNTGNHEWFTATSGTAGNAISFTQAMTLDASGRLGIGTTTINDILSIAQSSATAATIRLENTSTGRAVLQLVNNDGVTNNNNWSIEAGRDNTRNLAFRDNLGGERMRITSGGNVGIGTSTPGSKLSVVGLPTSSAGLSAGDIWNDGGTLKIV